MKSDQFYSIREVADYLRICEATAYRLVDGTAKDRIGLSKIACRVGRSLRFRKADVHALGQWNVKLPKH